MSQVTTKWGEPEKTHTVRFFHDRIRALIAQRAAAANQPWAQVANARTMALLSADDLLAIERELLASGYRFDPSATVSLREAPEKYKPPREVKSYFAGTPAARAEAAASSAEAATADAQGRSLVGDGDNLVHSATAIRGIARFISSIDEVTQMLIDGVPENTVAVIDDSGGTLTAPILEDFKAVLCLGGTVRAHLGILTREYGIPCFMSCKLDASLKDGDTVELETTAAAVAGEDYETGKAVRAKVWKVESAS